MHGSRSKIQNVHCFRHFIVIFILRSSLSCWRRWQNVLLFSELPNWGLSTCRVIRSCQCHRLPRPNVCRIGIRTSSFVVWPFAMRHSMRWRWFHFVCRCRRWQWRSSSKRERTYEVAAWAFAFHFSIFFCGGEPSAQGSHSARTGDLDSKSITCSRKCMKKKTETETTKRWDHFH